MCHGLRMHDVWNALLLCVLLGSVQWAEGQAESPESEPAIDEESEIVGSSLPDASEPPDSEGYGIIFSMPAFGRGMEELNIPARGDNFPDVLLTVDVLLPASDVDIYCRPGRGNPRRTFLVPRDYDYKWKSDHRHGNDYVFISKHHPEYRRSTMEENGTMTAYITCTLVEQAGVSARGTMGVWYSYATRELVKREQNALDNIFQECCQGTEHCKKWKEHIAQDNAEATDFCHYLGNFCNEGRLIQLDLNDQNMSCVFPGEELAKFQRLEKLQLKGNQLKGRLDDVFEDVLKFKNLEQLEIWGASFTGALAEDATDREALVCEVARQGVLVQLHLVDCGITGPLPHCLLDTESKLRDINLNGNRLSGELPNVAFEESRLLDLVLADNAFTGTIPKSWTSFRNLQALDLSSNQLSGDIPKGFNNSRHLQIMNLANNQLTGSISVDLVADKDLFSLNISHNRLTGELPDNFFSAARNLRVIDLRNNSLSGPISPSVADIARLLLLNLGHNKFSGPIPSELGDMEDLFSVFLDNNALSGPLPATLGRLRYLHAIHFQSNALNGTIPPEWQTIGNLRFLRLDDNQLEGEIPGWMLNSYNPLIPRYLRANLTSNKFSRFDEIWYDSPTTPRGIIDFFAAHNQIEGEFPTKLARHLSLRQLDLSANKMTGKLPSEENSFRYVHTLNLSNNAFRGTIPETWAKSSLFIFSEPTMMDLSNNKLSGKIPEFLYTSENSEVDRRFFLRGNRFNYECPLPNELFYIQDLECNEAEAPASLTAVDLEEEMEGETSTAPVSVTAADVEEERETEISMAPASLIATDLGEENQESAASVRSLSDRVSTQASPSISSATSSSSSNILVPILATVAAVCFAVVAVLVAWMIKRRKTQRESMVTHEISLSEWPDSHQDPTKEATDDAPMYTGAGSSAPV